MDRLVAAARRSGCSMSALAWRAPALKMNQQRARRFCSARVPPRPTLPPASSVGAHARRHSVVSQRVCQSVRVSQLIGTYSQSRSTHSHEETRQRKSVVSPGTDRTEGAVRCLPACLPGRLPACLPARPSLPHVPFSLLSLVASRTHPCLRGILQPTHLRAHTAAGHGCGKASAAHTHRCRRRGSRRGGGTIT